MGLVSFDIRDVIGGVIVFGMFFWTPIMSNHLLQKYKMKILGEELVPFVMPIIAGVGINNQEWSIGMLGLMASAGYFLGMWRLGRKKERIS